MYENPGLRAIAPTLPASADAHGFILYYSLDSILDNWLIFVLFIESWKGKKACSSRKLQTKSATYWHYFSIYFSYNFYSFQHWLLDFILGNIIIIIFFLYC